MRGITKRFPGVTALDRVDFSLRAGEVHLLMGENGAGKSTLMKVLSGAYARDGGDIMLDGQKVEIGSPHRARELGIAMIYQEMTLVPQLTVAENIFLGREFMRAGLLDRRRMRAEAAAILSRLHAGISPDQRVGELPVAQQQMVEISRALSMNARIVVMDEPTSPLAQREVAGLFRVIRNLRSAGRSVIYISHRLAEARRIGDRVTVLRDGRITGAAPLRRMSDSRLVRLMVGRPLSRHFPRVTPVRGKCVLRVEGLARNGTFGPVSFSLARGEILGFAGLIGSGRTEVARCLAGADRATSGSIELEGRILTVRDPASAKRAGIVLLPEDRKGQGLVLGLPLVENVSLAMLHKLSRFGFIRSRLERKGAGRMAKKLRIRTPSLDQTVRFLSGGNQQKVVLAKWLSTSPRVMLFDEPTRGIDVGAKYEVYRLMAGLASSGVGVIFISSDLDEVLGISHRVAVMRAGKLAGILARSRATPERVMRLAMGLGRS